MNSITLKGRMTRDPELRYTQSGVAVASFNIAVDRRYTPQGQEKQCDFIDCVAWKQGGEFVSKYFTKGQEILVRGSLQSRKWEDKDGNKRISWEVIVEETDFCGSKTGTSGDGSFRPAGAAKDVVNDDTTGAFSELDNSDGDLPFSIGL